MPTVTRVIQNTYRDSVALMQLSARLSAEKDIEQVAVVMATPANLALLREASLLTGEPAARPSDVLALVQAKNAGAAERVLAQIEIELQSSPSAVRASGAATAAALPRSIDSARRQLPDANLALISVPGEYAAAEAHKALDAGLNVMLFSDNVAPADEVALKRKAADRGLLVMGPDCGTAIIDGVPLGFANVVRAGTIGCIGASGTGLQQVTALIDQAGRGVSQAIGTGGRDLSEAVGGATMLAALALLAKDRATKVIVLIAKPPHPAVAKKVLAAAAKARKPVVVCFIGADLGSAHGRSLHPVSTLEEAADRAVELAAGRVAARRRSPVAPTPRWTSSQQYLRGLYSGGTFCYEASMLLEKAFASGREGRVWSNAAVDPASTIDDVWTSREHTLIDLGDDVFTRGRPHPMIDHRLRNARMVEEAADPSVAVLLFDVVLGHGSHANPAEAMLPAIREAKARAAKAKRAIVMIGFVCGTDADPQGRAAQEQALSEAGVLLAPSNAQAVALAARIIKGMKRVGAAKR